MSHSSVYAVIKSAAVVRFQYFGAMRPAVSNMSQISVWVSLGSLSFVAEAFTWRCSLSSHFFSYHGVIQHNSLILDDNVPLWMVLNTGLYFDNILFSCTCPSGSYVNILTSLVVLNGSHLLPTVYDRTNIWAMRNLELLRSFPLLELDGTEEPFCLTVDCDCGVVYTATATGITGFQPSTQEVSCRCSCRRPQTRLPWDSSRERKNTIESSMCGLLLVMYFVEMYTNLPFSYFQFSTGTTLQWRSLQGNYI